RVVGPVHTDRRLERAPGGARVARADRDDPVTEGRDRGERVAGDRGRREGVEGTAGVGALRGDRDRHRRDHDRGARDEAAAETVPHRLRTDGSPASWSATRTVRSDARPSFGVGVEPSKPSVSCTRYSGRARTSSWIRETYSPITPIVRSWTPPRNVTAKMIEVHPGTSSAPDSLITSTVRPYAIDRAERMNPKRSASFSGAPEKL